MDVQHMSDKLALEQLFHRFVDAGLHGRFTEAFDLADESYTGIGMGEQGMVSDKEEALLVLQDGFRMAEGTTITYDVQNFTISQFGENAAIVYGKVIITTTLLNNPPMHSGLMQTIGARRFNEGWRITFTHASPTVLTVESVEAYPVRFLDGTLSALRTALLAEQTPHCDVLTGVLNREGLELRARELEQEYNPHHNTVLFMLDLDDFKQINDRLGHQTGDAVLHKVAQTLRSTFRDGDAVGRIGGDEFMVLLSGNFSVKFLEKKAEELLQALRLQVTKDQQIPISVSIGIAYGRARTTFDKLYLIADTALYAAKRAGKARYHLINSDTNTQHSCPCGDANLLSLQTLLKHADGTVPSIGRTPYETLVENIPGGVIVFEFHPDAPFHFTLCNEWFSRLVDYSNNEITAMQAENPFSLIHPDDYPVLTRMLQTMVDGVDNSNVIYRVCHRDGSYTHIKLVAAVTERDHDSVIVFATMTDVDELIRLRQAVENSRIAEELEQTPQGVGKDELTGLLNKRAFYQEMQDLILRHPKENFVLIRWNLERFKVINDLFGAGVGDQILKTLAQTLQNYTDGLAALARLESDHFVSCYFATHFSLDTVQKILGQQLSPPEINYPITLKCGIYEIDDKTLPIDQMCDRASLALQTIKGKYLAQHVFYDAALRQALLAEQEIEGDMEQALEEGQFIVYFQPIYSVSTERPVSAEALVRWKHPTKGMISPGVFVPLFEKNGFISKLDRYVREQTLRFIAQSLAQHRPIIPISVNISRIEFYSVDFCEKLFHLVEQYQVHPSMLRLEITESAYMHNADALLSAMRELQNYGFQILMDDFGSGYSLLNMLKDIPVNILKIDMRFVQDITSSDRAASVLSSVVRMAKWLEMQVVAEGVETIEQLAFLRSIGCDSVQGYYYSKPLPEADFVQLSEQDALDKSRKKQVDALDEPAFDLFWNTQQGVALLNAMVGPVGIYELGEDHLELICVNDAYYEMTGITPSTLFSETLQATSWIYQDDRDAVLHACRQAVGSRRTQRIKVRRYHSRGRMLWVDMRIRYIGHRNARSVFCLEMDDITEPENQKRINELESYIVDMFYIYDVIYQLNYTAMTSTTMYYTSGSILNTDRAELWKGLCVFLEQLHPADRPILQEIFAIEALRIAFADGRKTLEQRARVFHNGQYRWFSMVIVRATHANEEVYLACIKVLQRQETTADDAPTPPLSLEPQNQTNQPRLKVLVVDDNKLNRMMLQKMLADRYDILDAENGQQALQLLVENWRDIVAIMLDIVMPIMDGYAFLEARATNDSFAAIPVIVLSHSDDRDAELRALSLGANDFLKKPYEPVVIKQRLANFIRLREIAERSRHSEETVCELTQENAALAESNAKLLCELEQMKKCLNLGGVPDGTQ